MCGLASVLACAKVPDSVDVNLGLQSGGSITGRVVYDPGGTGSYVGTPGAIVVLSGFAYGCNTTSAPCTLTVSDGEFSFTDVAEGSYTLNVTKIIRSPYQVFDCNTGVTVTKQNVSDVGDLRLGVESGPPGSGGSCR